MTSAQRLALGFVIGGIVMLLAHPRSRPIMGYAFQPDTAKRVLDSNLLSNEPLEFFPPDAGEMTDRKRFLSAFRIVRRLRTDSVKPDQRDLAIVRRFLGACSDFDPDNAYWPQLMAAVEGYSGETSDAQAAWEAATKRGRWDTGEGEALSNLWDELSKTDGQRLAWQGVVALDHASEGASEFIRKHVSTFAFVDIAGRYQSLANAAVILESSRSFATASAAIKLADMAVFGRAEPIEALGQRRYEEAKTEFPRLVAENLSAEAGERARKDIQTVESWQAFYRTGDSMARSALHRLRVESLLTASLPSSLFAASLAMLAIGLGGTVVAAGLGPVLNPDRRAILLVGVITGALLWWQSGVFLLAVWAMVIAGVLSIPQMTARDVPIGWRPAERLAVVCVAIVGMLLLAFWSVLESPPARYLGGQDFDGAFYGAVGGLTLSLALPCAAVWARIRKVSIMRAVGETMRLLGFSGAIIGIAATVLIAPFALWRDAANRSLLEDWIRNEPATFRPDAPQ